MCDFSKWIEQCAISDSTDLPCSEILQRNVQLFIWGAKRPVIPNFENLEAEEVTLIMSNIRNRIPQPHELYA